MGHGLKHPGDLVAWRRWHESRHPVRGAARAARARLRPPIATLVDVLTPAAGGDLLVAVEATHASVDRAVVAPLHHLPAERTSIVCPVGWLPPDAYAAHDRRTVSLDLLPTLVAPGAVLAAGHYTEIGAAAFALADDLGVQFFVSQHGALTPFAPPLPRAAHLLAWSDADAEFWTAGRDDITVTSTGSQLLWEAGLGFDTGAGRPAQPATTAGAGRPAQPATTAGAGRPAQPATMAGAARPAQPATTAGTGRPAQPATTAGTGRPAQPATSSGPLTYLGQGHAAEISRARLMHAAFTTCREHGAVYRPHPSERDVASRLALAAYARAGITVDTSGVPLVELTSSIVSVFSTGVLEAAARGLDAWVDFPRPPAWLAEFWERYGMSRCGTDPTPAPARPDAEPAQRIAEILNGAAS